jgi:hypothetical protein
LLTQILLVCGCAVTPKRPSQIPAFAAGDEKLMPSHRIVGRYADKGEAFTDKGKSLEQASLSQLLFGSDPVYAEADTVNVVEPESDVIDFQFSQKGQSVTTRRISKYTWSKATGGRGIFANWDSSKYGQPYYVVKGFIDIAISESHGGASGVGMYVAGTDCLLRKGIDGSLIVLQKESGFAVVVIVPVGGSHCTWYRFPPIADGDQPQPQPR